MNPKNRAERVVALDAITEEAEKSAPLAVKSFTVGARKELADQRPDTEQYFDAAVAAKKAKNNFWF